MLFSECGTYYWIIYDIGAPLESRLENKGLKMGCDMGLECP